MKTISIIFLLLFSVCAVAQKNALVTRVKDGDTFVARWNGKAYDCRLANVDAPELKQAFGVASKDSLLGAILGKTVLLDSLKKDLYGRVLVNVRLGSIRLDSLMVRKGWAWHYVIYSNDAVLKSAMRKAASERQGLWGCGAQRVCPPWHYRRYSYRNKLIYCSGC